MEQKPLTTPLEDFCKKTGITMGIAGQKEAKKKGVATLPVKKFAFAPRQLSKPQLTIQSQEERQQNMANLENYRREIGPFLFDLVSQRRALFSGTTEEVAIAKADIDTITEAIAAELNQEHPLGKQSAVLAYADAMVKTCPEFRGQVEQTLKDLIGIGFLTEVGNGKGRHIYGRDYDLAKEFAKNSEARSVFEAMSPLVGRTIAAGKARFNEDLTALKTAVGDNPLTVEELENGSRDGRTLLLVPDYTYRERFHKGGFLLVESTGGQIRTLDGAGGCQNIARLLARTETFVWHSQLGSEHPELNTRLPEEAYRNFRIAHGLLRRGVVAAKQEAARYEEKAGYHRQTDAERETLRAKATLSPVEFFLFERQGTAVLDPLGREPFEIKNRDRNKRPILVWDVIALVERNEHGRVRVADCPERLTEFFAKTRQFAEPGEKFTKIPWPLGLLLRMGYAAAFEEATAEQKSVAEAQRAQAEAARKAAEVQAQQQLATELAAGTGETLEGVSIPDPTEGR